MIPKVFLLFISIDWVIIIRDSVENTTRNEHVGLCTGPGMHMYCFGG